MADAVGALLQALTKADLCRHGSNLQAICDPCWLDVGRAVEAVNATRETDKPAQVPVPDALSGHDLRQGDDDWWTW